jgi:cellobiose-specific phosphotransferase system component IIC
VSLMVAVIVSTSLSNNMHLLAVFANLVMTLTFITVLHRFLYSEVEDPSAMFMVLCVVTERKTAP